MNIYSFIRQQRQYYKTRSVKLTDNFNYNQYEVLNLIELYFNSQYKTGNLDSLGREKAFFNINKFRVNVAVRATDLDVKDIVIESDSSDDYVRSFLLTKENQSWMKEVNMAKFLNDMGHTRAKYGGVLVKKTEHNGKLGLHVVPWKDVVTDQTDIMKGVIIERHFYTPAELKEKAGIWNNIDEAIASAQDNKDDYNETRSKQTPGDYIEVYEVHGVLPEAYLKDADSVKLEDWHEYCQQVHIIAGIDSYSVNEQTQDIVENGVTLYSSEEKSSPYKYLSWQEIPGRALGVGIVEDSIEAQVWTNDAVNKSKEAMELGSKVLFQSTDKTVGKNVLTDLENGDIITTKPGTGLEQLSTITNAVPEFTGLINLWKDQLDRTTSTFEANIGESLPSGTPYRLGAILQNEGNSIFDYRKQEMGIFIQELYSEWIMPYLIKKLTKGHVLAADFSQEELQNIDDAYISFLLRESLSERVAGGNISDTPETLGMEEQKLRTQLQRTKSKRFIQVPKNYYQDIDSTVTVVVTNENQPKAAMMESLSNILSTVSQNPAVLQNPVTLKIFNKIMELAGFSPAELQIEPAQPGPAQQQPQGQPQPQMAGQPQAQPQGVPNGQ